MKTGSAATNAQGRSKMKPTQARMPVLQDPPAAVSELGAAFIPRSELRRHLPAIHQQRGARYIGCEVRCQEGNGGSHFVGLAASAKWNVLKVVAQESWIVEEPFREPRSDQARADGIHSDSERAQLIRPVVSDAQPSGLAGVV